MSDIANRFAAGDLIPVDDLMAAVKDRLRAPDEGRVADTPVPIDRRQRRERPRRILTIAAAAAIAAAAFLFMVQAFDSTGPLPAAPRLLVTPPAGWVPPGMLGPDGALYVTDCLDARVLRVDLDGRVTEFAGAGAGGFTNGFSGDGGPATRAHFGCPTGIGWDAGGRLFVVDQLNDRVRMIDTNGIITTIAGDLGSDLGDGGPASQAGLTQPTYLAFSGDGSLYFVDRDAARIRKIDSTGVISTVVGTGRPGFSGDGGPATRARIDTPNGLVFDAAGNLYFSDGANNRVRKVDTNGIITTIAGTGDRRLSGDGGPAVDASLADPSGLAFDDAGNLYIADYDHNLIRVVDPAGRISTVAGTGKTSGPARYRGPALRGDIVAPETLTFGDDGRLYITEDSDAPRVLVLNPASSTLSTLAKRCVSGAVIGTGC
jgi:sugar lactone lactonase YvrE